MTCDPSTTITTQDLTDLKSDFTTIDTVVESYEDTTVTKDGKTINTLTGQLKLIGWQPPIDYAGGILFDTNDGTKVIERSGPEFYAPLPSALPFTTSGTWAGDDEDKFQFILYATAENTSLTVNGNVTNVSAHLNQRATTNLNLLNYGATGGNLALDNAALVAAIAVLKAAGGGTLYAPKTALPYRLTRNYFDACNNITITGSGVFKTDDSQTGSSQMFHITNSTKFIFDDQIVLDGNRSVLEPFATVGFYDSPVTFKGCTKCGFKGEILSSVGVGVNINNGSIGCFVKGAIISDTRYAGVQSHAGSLDFDTGDYDDNQPIFSTVVEGCTFTDCREDMRFTGNRDSVARGNKVVSTIADKANSIFIYTGTSPNAAGIGGLENGSKNISIEHNSIDVVLDNTLTNASGILVLNALDAGGTSAKPVNGTKIKSNDVTTYDTTGLSIRGFNVAGGEITNTTVYDNDWRFNAANEAATAYAITRLVYRTKYEKNRVHGQVRYGWSVNPDGVEIKGIQCVDEWLERTTSPIFKSLSSSGGTVDKVNLERVNCDDVCTISGKFTSEPYAIQMTGVDNSVSVRDCTLTPVTNPAIQFFRGDAAYESGLASIEDNDLTDYTASIKIQFSNASPLNLPLVRGNLGYLSEAIGKATMLSGTNSVLVDLSDLAGLNYIHATPNESTLTQPWWALKSGTNLQIRVTSNVAADTDFTYSVSQWRTV